MTAAAVRNHRRSIRAAAEEDDVALQALARACPMGGDPTICVRREPRFLALDALLGDPWRVLVAESGDGVVGCIAWAVRPAYVNGDVRPTAYVGDLKVHPAHRRNGVGTALALAAREALRELDPEIPVLLTALHGNTPVVRLCRHGGRDSVARHHGTIRVHAIPLLGRRRPSPVSGYAVHEAGAGDLDEMTSLWSAVAPTRQFAVWRDGPAFADVLERAPGLELPSYLVVRDRRGRMAAFLAIWDQEPLKRTTIVRYGTAMRLFRFGFNLATPLLGAAPLPEPGGTLRSLHAFHVCATSPAALRAGLAEALRRHAGRGRSVLMIGLDQRDPLTAALTGLWARPIDVDAMVAVPGRLGGCALLDARPLHYETGLV